VAESSPSELLIRQRVAALDRTLPDALGGDVSAIHDARVATRRLREAVPLVARGSKRRRLSKPVRELTRALGTVRELDVALLTLDELQTGDDLPTAGIALLREIITGERQRLCVGMSHEIERVDLDKVKRKVLAAAGETRVGRGRQSSLDPKRLTAARRRAGRRANALCAAIENAGGIYLPDRLHQVRIAVKKLRYAMEIARELSGSRAVARIRLLKNVQDELGRMHDLEMLIMRIRALQGSDRAPNLKLSADLDRVVRRLETECRQLHVRYMGFKQKLLQVCDHVTAALDELKGNPAA
jgi:CHAD domain-containing protein